MSITNSEFKQVMQNWASGVSVITTHSPTHGILGMTATSFASVSMEPPQILVCVNDSAISASGIQERGLFAVNFLSREQKEISNLFAGGASTEDRFAKVKWSANKENIPTLDESLASMICKLVNAVRAGTHWVFIGEIDEIICRPGEPLLYFRANYRELSETIL